MPCRCLLQPSGHAESINLCTGTCCPTAATSERPHHHGARGTRSFMTPAGLEPAIPGSIGRCLIHWATGPVATCPVKIKSKNTRDNSRIKEVRHAKLHGNSGVHDGATARAKLYSNNFARNVGLRSPWIFPHISARIWKVLGMRRKEETMKFRHRDSNPGRSGESRVS